MSPLSPVVTYLHHLCFEQDLLFLGCHAFLSRCDAVNDTLDPTKEGYVSQSGLNTAMKLFDALYLETSIRLGCLLVQLGPEVAHDKGLVVHDSMQGGE